jgi:hypothetical protein
MAQIIQTTFVITVSKLVKDTAGAHLLDAEQSNMLIQTLPGVVEELLNDPALIVELQSIVD